MILNENESKNLLTKILGYSKADSVEATLSGSNSYNLRFARNSLTTNGFIDGLTLSVSSNFGKKTGSVSTNKFDDESLKAAVKNSELIAALSPDNKEFMPPLGPQSYSEAGNYSSDTENLNSGNRSGLVSYVLDSALSNDVTCAGFEEDEVSFTAVISSNGLFAYNKGTNAKFSSTFRTKDGTGSSRFEKIYTDINKLGSKKLSDKAVIRSKLSMNPEELKPGRYTVILEPSAAADMITLCLNFMSSRSADEGRSFFSRPGGGNLTGETIAGSNVNIYSDPTDVNAPSVPFSGSGEPRNRVTWIEKGILKNLHRGRFWAEKTSQPSISYPSNILMTGTEKTLEEMISETDSAILVTRFWYIRTVDPKTMLLTGLTRDGVFEIKGGKIIRPVKNFRFNESPVNVLKNLLDIGKSEKSVGTETDEFPIHVPPLKVANFNFSSLSDAI
ncbi:MAG: TldD/PmbA family protein [Ignavibacteria bacterium]